MSTSYYLLIRVVLWTIAVIVAALPVALNDDVDLEWNLWASIESINKAGVFRELFFVLIPLGLLSISTVLDHLCRKFYKLSGTSAALSILSLVFNSLALCSGLVGFVKIPHASALTPGQLWTYSVLIGLGMFVSAATELGVSLEHRR